jgi:tryptophan synthase alpha chain
VNRIENRFKELKSKRQKGLVAFITAGDPDMETTERVFHVLEKNGADIVEIGVPFTDPLADGPVILQSALRSLDAGTTLEKILKLVGDIRKNSQLPIVLMSSYNPIFVYGDKRFIDDALKAGVDGAIIPDLPPEEGKELAAYAKEKEFNMIYLLAPTSTPKRVERVLGQSGGFVYYISLTGVTGVRSSLAEGIEEKVSKIREKAELPVLIGFGISDQEQAKKAAEISDGVIVGSALVKTIHENSDSKTCDEKVGALITELKNGVMEASPKPSFFQRIFGF